MYVHASLFLHGYFELARCYDINFHASELFMLVDFSTVLQYPSLWRIALPEMLILALICGALPKLTCVFLPYLCLSALVRCPT